MKITMPPLVRILAALLVVQVGLTALTFWPRAAAGQSGPLFPDLDTAAVTQVAIRGSSGDEIVMAKSGDNWVLPNADDFPVTADKVRCGQDRGAAHRRLVPPRPPARHACRWPTTTMHPHSPSPTALSP
jgi:hypothetical protein